MFILADDDAVLDQILETLEADKAEDITVINLKGRTTIADHMVIATGRSARQVGAMAEHLAAKMRAAGLHPSTEGMAQCDWVLIDGHDIIVHLFRPEIREFYNLEKMWSGPRAAPATA